jgi:hypothetical protein
VHIHGCDLRARRELYLNLTGGVSPRLEAQPDQRSPGIVHVAGGSAIPAVRFELQTFTAAGIRRE